MFFPDYWNRFFWYVISAQAPKLLKWIFCHFASNFIFLRVARSKFLYQRIPQWSRLFLISSTCVQNDFWRFWDAIKQKIEHLRSKKLQNWVFTFLNVFFCHFASNFIFLRVARPKFVYQRIPRMKFIIFDIFNVRSKWFWTLLQRNSTKNWAFEGQKPPKLSFHFLKWVFCHFASNFIFLRVARSKFFTNVSPEWSRLFLISSTCIQNDFWRFCDAI